MSSTIAARAPCADSSDAEIDMLLAEAETRMRESALSIQVAASNPSRTPEQSEPKLQASKAVKPYIYKGAGGTALITNAGRKANLSSRPQGKPTELSFMRVDDPIKAAKQSKEKKDETAGPGWYHMPAPQVTPQLKRDLEMIKLRNVLDPHKHFKGDDWKGKLPKYFQMGTLIEGPTEYYSARLNNKDRHKSMVDEILASSASKSRFKKKYDEIQAKKRSGRKEFYKKLKEKRGKGKY
ncbi:hypothetical protein DRE_06218 [Drechslerella stenobrocha 248]|uniref:Fcf2 pre-rRNA processing C-terminal domain-containing protein n=1 Tax=Drechslerella stenobrocha 248 TaxID=1043628 RepID=W7HPN0_9PEZI|nr:hypothetical protein DRE_06218 [Drechslerella stenobrocha 248]